MGILEIIGLFGSLIGASMLATMISEVRKRLESDQRLRFWIALTAYLLVVAVRLIFFGLGWITDNENIVIGAVAQVVISGYFIWYIHKIYLSK